MLLLSDDILKLIFCIKKKKIQRCFHILIPFVFIILEDFSS